MKFKFLFIFIFFLFFAFFNDLVVPFPALHWNVQVTFIFSIITFCIFFIKYYKQFIIDIKKLLIWKNSSFRIYIYLISYILFQTIIFGILGKINVVSSLLDIIAQYFIVFMLCYLTTFFIIKRIFKISYVIKIMYSTIFIILIFGILDFFAYNFNIGFLQTIVHLPNNTSTLVAGNDFFNKSIANNFYRVQSIYFEPGYFAEHLFILLPLIYGISNSKFKIYKNKLLNKIIKKIFVPLTWINIVLTQSPMWLCLSLLLTFIMFYKKIIYFLLNYYKHTIVSLIIILVLLLESINIDVENSYLSRILKVTNNITNINSLIIEEPSLGTRLSCIFNLIDIGMSSPVFGIGHSNIKPQMIKQIQNNNSKIQVTREMYYCILVKESPSFQNPILVNFFVRYGVIALILFLFFIFKLRKNLSILSKNASSIVIVFSKSLSMCLLCILIVGCYDIAISDYVCHFIIGCCLGLEQYLHFDQNNIFNKARLIDENGRQNL